MNIKYEQEDKNHIFKIIINRENEDDENEFDPKVLTNGI